MAKQINDTATIAESLPITKESNEYVSSLPSLSASQVMKISIFWQADSLIKDHISELFQIETTGRIYSTKNRSAGERLVFDVKTRSTKDAKKILNLALQYGADISYHVIEQSRRKK
jgi:hypothetical protein